MVFLFQFFDVIGNAFQILVCMRVESCWITVRQREGMQLAVRG